MKKTLFTIIAMYACIVTVLSAPAPDAPDAVIKLSPPKQLFDKLQAALRKIYPNPKFEMQASFALMPLGYPSFAGVSTNACPAILAYVNDDNKIFYVAAVAADDTSAVANFAKNFKLQHLREGDWLVIGINIPNQIKLSDYSEHAIKLAKKLEIADLSIELHSHKQLPESLRDAAGILAQADTAKLSARIDTDSFDLRFLLKAAPNSGLAKAFNSLPTKRKNIVEANFIPDDFEIALLYNFNPSAEFGLSDIISQEANSLDKSATQSLGTGTTVYAKGFSLSIDATTTDFAQMQDACKDFNVDAKAAISKLANLPSGIKFDVEEIKVNSTQAMVLKATLGNDSKIISYNTICSGYAVKSDSKELFANAVQSILQKRDNISDETYSNLKCDALIIFNINQILKSQFTNFKTNQSFNNAAISLTCLRNALEAETHIGYDILSQALGIWIATEDMK